MNESLKYSESDFRRIVRDRLFNEHSSEIHVSRCSNCQRIVKTPKSKQCLWCGYDWHAA